MSSIAAPSHLLRTSRRLSAVGAVVIAAVIVTAGLTIWDLHGDAIEDYKRDMTNMGALIADQTSRSFQAVDLVVKDVGRQVAADGVEDPAALASRMGTESFHRFLQAELKGLPQAQALILVGVDGRVINYSRQWPVQRINVGDRDFFRHLHDHDDPNAFISAPVRSRATHQSTFYLTRRLDDAHGRFLGVVEAAISPNYWDASYRHITVEEGTVVGFVRRDGTILARYPYIAAKEGRHVPRQSPWYQRVAQGGGAYSSAQPWADGIVRIVSVHLLKDFPVVVTVGFAERAVLAHWRFQTLCVVIGALVVVLGFAVLFSALAEQFTRLEGQASELAVSADALRDARDRRARRPRQVDVPRQHVA